MEKLTIIVRADIDPGLQIAQSCHALAGFADLHPGLFSPWVRDVKNIACLSDADEPTLAELYRKAVQLGLARACFHEPDLGGALTAIALGEGARRICSHLPKALRDLARKPVAA